MIQITVASENNNITIGTNATKYIFKNINSKFKVFFSFKKSKVRKSSNDGISILKKNKKIKKKESEKYMTKV
jgi:hypothetical protein